MQPLHGVFSGFKPDRSEISPLSDCVLLFLFFQSLSASLKGKKADAGPWIDILTSRDSDHLNKGEAVMYFSYIVLAYSVC